MSHLATAVFTSFDYQLVAKHLHVYNTHSGYIHYEILLLPVQDPHTGAEILKCLTPAMVLCSVPHVMRSSSEFLWETFYLYRTFRCQVH